MMKNKTNIILQWNGRKVKKQMNLFRTGQIILLSQYKHENVYKTITYVSIEI